MSINTKQNTICNNCVLFLVLTFALVPAFAADSQVTALDIWHHHGQTFITFKEVDPPDIADDIDCGSLKKLIQKLRTDEEIYYKIYRSDKSITNVADG